jgi:hypothetical protein
MTGIKIGVAYKLAFHAPCPRWETELEKYFDKSGVPA